MTGFIGSKYNRDLDVTEIAKLVRANIKAAIAAGELPKGLKASVRIDRYSGGQSLDVTITSLGGSYALNPARVKWDIDHPHDYPGDAPARHTAVAANAIAKIKLIVGAYNFDHSDSQTDYFNVNFYGDVKIGWEIERAERGAIAAGGSFEDLSGAPTPPAPEPDNRPIAPVIQLFDHNRAREAR